MRAGHQRCERLERLESGARKLFKILQSKYKAGPLFSLDKRDGTVFAAGVRLAKIKVNDSRSSDALWNAGPESFLAHGEAGHCDEAAQPVLLSSTATGGNGAHYCAIADGDWREDVDGYERIFFLFEPDKIEAARAAWKTLSAREGWQCHYWMQDGRRWTRAA